MKKIIASIKNFMTNNQSEYCTQFSKLVSGQTPEALLITCCDSRVNPNLVTGTEPGDLFVTRNIGNLVPPYNDNNNSETSVQAAVEYALVHLNIKHIIVMGHSECGAMGAVLADKKSERITPLSQWLEYAKPSFQKFNNGTSSVKNPSDLSQQNFLSQINVVQQLEHLKTHSLVMGKLETKQLTLHGWWFDLESANIEVYDAKNKTFDAMAL